MTDDLDPNPWVALHGATIIRVVREGEQVELGVEQQELRGKFPGRGVGFVIRLSGCSELQYEPDDEPPIVDPQQIASSEPAILDAKSAEGDMLVACAGGTLRVRYASLTIGLDTGGDVALADLRARSSVIAM